eukprot:6184665-Pleurochrysis_carterae.AAC.2
MVEEVEPLVSERSRKPGEATASKAKTLELELVQVATVLQQAANQDNKGMMQLERKQQKAQRQRQWRNAVKRELRIVRATVRRALTCPNG